jgi:uncharacterized protein
MRIVFDASVLISAVLRPNTIPANAWDLALEKRFDILSSASTLNELKEKLPSNKFDKYVSLEDRLKFFLLFQERSKLIAVSHRVTICRDFKDNQYLELALSGKADCIVTKDNDLLVLNPFENIPIVTPLEFLERHS